MVYVTVKQSPMYHQMSLEEFLFGGASEQPVLNQNMTNTRTYEFQELSEYMRRKLGVSTSGLIQRLAEFNAKTEQLRAKPRHDLYYEFYIPKKSGGLRKIDAPQPELMDALRELKTIFEENFHALYHTAAFAYIRHRSTVDAIKRHQSNESRWYAKYDLSNFFGSTTLDFILKMFAMIYPFSEVANDQTGYVELKKALELAILDGGLPQGTPISPIITNIMMIPVDYKISNALRDFNKQRYVYTRYADDFQVSSRYDFSFREVEQLIVSTLAEFGAPFTLNKQKTRYGSTAGRNFNLGLMVCNGDDGGVRITVGAEKKRRFKAMLSSFVLDTLHGKPWDINDVQVMEGHRNYYRMVEGETIDDIVNNIGKKYGVDILKMIKEQLSV